MRNGYDKYTWVVSNKIIEDFQQEHFDQLTVFSAQVLEVVYPVRGLGQPPKYRVNFELLDTL